MNLSDYEAIWKRQPLPVGDKADLTDLTQAFEAKRRKLERTIMVRNSVEGIGGVLASVGFGLLTWRMGIIGWQIVLGLLLIAAVSGVFLRDAWRFQRRRVGPEAPLLAKLEGNIAELRHQRRLLAHIGKWYLLPYLAAIGLLGYGLAQHAGRHAPPRFLLTLLTTPATLAWILLMFLVLFWALWRWWRDIQSATRLRIDPRLQELEKMRRALLTPESQADAKPAFSEAP